MRRTPYSARGSAERFEHDYGDRTRVRRSERNSNEHPAIERHGNGIVEERFAFDDGRERLGTLSRRKTATTAIGSVATKDRAGQERRSNRHAHDRQSAGYEERREEYAGPGERQQSESTGAGWPDS